MCLLALLVAGCGSGNNNNGDGGGGGGDMAGGGADDMLGDASPLDKCPGVAINADGVLDVDVKSVKVSGWVTLAGAALPDEGARLVFVDKDSGASAGADLLPGGNYSTVLGPGTYDVRWSGAAGGCDQRLTPCLDGVIRAGVALTSSGVLDLDIKAVKVSGKVSFKGATLPATESGSVLFALADGTVASQVVGNGDPNYAITVLPGSYTVSFDSQGTCDGPLPCNTGVIKSALNLSSDGVLDLDVAATHVSGKVTVNGKAWSATSNASVVFSPVGGKGASASQSLTATGSYSVVLAPGSYDVSYSGNGNQCDAATANAPCNSGKLKTAVNLTSDGVLDLDAPMVKVSGKATLKGGAFPAAASKGSITFALDTASVASRPLGTTTTYSVALLKGSYTVGFAGSPSACDGMVPCNAGPLKSAVSLMADGVLDLDVPAVRVTGTVSVNGAAMATATQTRGTLSLVPAGVTGASGIGKSITAGGAASYGLTVLPGSYDVVWSGNSSLCRMASPPAIPCNSGTVMAKLSLSADGALDVDVPAARVTGQVTLNGGAMPVDPSNNATVSWKLVGGSSVSAQDFGSAGASRYTVTLLKGNYVASFDADTQSCGGTTMVPCTNQPLVGCK